MKIVHPVENKIKTVKLKDLPIGTLGILNDPYTCEYNGQVVLRVYDRLVSLSDPNLIWDALGILVKPFPIGYQIILEQTE